MEILRDTKERDDTRTAIQLLMCHTGLLLFYDPNDNGLEILKVKLYNNYNQELCLT